MTPNATSGSSERRGNSGGGVARSRRKVWGDSSCGVFGAGCGVGVVGNVVCL